MRYGKEATPETHRFLNIAKIMTVHFEVEGHSPFLAVAGICCIYFLFFVSLRFSSTTYFNESQEIKRKESIDEISFSKVGSEDVNRHTVVPRPHLHEEVSFKMRELRKSHGFKPRFRQYKVSIYVH